ncbi:MAG: ABC transporter ATP-binding protein [Spirochaetales bacterium]|nr:ABC transporter ATP-binding protein [Spirochaetales bacterium]
MALLEMKKISKSFGFPALQNVDLSIDAGDRIGLIGPNGSGKTTLTNIITGLIACDDGQVIFENRDITKLSAHRRSRLGIARTFQIPQPFYSLIVRQNLYIPLRCRLKSEEAMFTEAGRLLDLVGLSDKADGLPSDLTQIEQRELELARALALSPRLLILDEVLAGLTSQEIDGALEILRVICESGVTVIMIEHIMKAVMGFCNKIVVLNSGMKIAEGMPEDIFRNPEVERAYLGE